MNTYYVVGYGQPGDRIVYYTGCTSAYGDGMLGDIVEAKKFATIEEALEIVKRDTLRVMLFEVADVTLKLIGKGYEDIYNGKDSDNAELYRKFNRASYVMNTK